jgi:hypothetical protein
MGISSQHHSSLAAPLMQRTEALSPVQRSKYTERKWVSLTTARFPLLVVFRPKAFPCQMFQSLPGYKPAMQQMHIGQCQPLLVKPEESHQQIWLQHMPLKGRRDQTEYDH